MKSEIAGEIPALYFMKKLNEKKWIEQELSYRSDGWEYILTFGGGYDIDALKDGPLKDAILAYQDHFYKLNSLLEKLGYEAG